MNEIILSFLISIRYFLCGNQLIWSGLKLPTVHVSALYVGAHTPVPFENRKFSQILVTRRPVVLWDYGCLMARTAELMGSDIEFIHMELLEDTSWKSWASFGAAVFFPYQGRLR